MEDLPSAQSYWKSYMHSDVVTHVVVSPLDYFLTGDTDGCVKFWKIKAHDIEFERQFRSHYGPIKGLAVSCDGRFSASISTDKTVKIYNKSHMVAMIDLRFLPGVIEWVYERGCQKLAVSERWYEYLYLYDPISGAKSESTIKRGHKGNIRLLKYNRVYNTLLSVTWLGVIEYWVPEEQYKFGQNCSAKRIEIRLGSVMNIQQNTLSSLEVSPNGKLFSVTTFTGDICVFRFQTGGLHFNVKGNDRGEALQLSNAVFDKSSSFLIFSNSSGIQILDLGTNQVVRGFGKHETKLQFSRIALYQGEGSNDPALICCALNKQRIYLFSQREPDECEGRAADHAACEPVPIQEFTDTYPFGVSHTTIEHFHSSLTSETKLHELLEILTLASEYSQLPTPLKQQHDLQRLIRLQKFPTAKSEWTDPHVKANALLQAYFSRTSVSEAGDLIMDQREVILSATRLLWAMIHVIISKGWLNLAGQAIKMSQMLTQGLWVGDSVLRQLPQCSDRLISDCEEMGVESVYDFIRMDDRMRHGILEDMLDLKFVENDWFCRRYPKIEKMSLSVFSSSEVTLHLTVERNKEGRVVEGASVAANRYPKDKEERWWIILGETRTNCLLAIKRVFLQKNTDVKLQFSSPLEALKLYTVYVMSESYLGCDIEYAWTL